jgi:hypothetical protein
MGGKKVVVELVVAPTKQTPPEQEGTLETETRKKLSPEAETAKVISLFDRK